MKPTQKRGLFLFGGERIEDITLWQGDCLELMKKISDKSVDMVLADPPYNIGVTTQKKGKNIKNQWDIIENYNDFFIAWILEAERILKDTGVLYFWHNDILTISEIIQNVQKDTRFKFVSFCVWNKGQTYRALSWKNRKPESRTAPRQWFNVCEYCLHFFKGTDDKTGLDRIYSNPNCFKPLKHWYKSELKRLSITRKDVEQKYSEVTGRKPFMVQRHYFNDNQFEIPTQKIWNSVFKPLGFNKEYEGLREEYERLREEYERLREEYEGLRNYHKCDENHCNVWNVPTPPKNKRYHTCQKPIEILERLCRVSCPLNGIVVDPFMGSGSTGVACVNTGRKFIGIEKDAGYFEVAKKRIEEAQTKIREVSV